MSPTSGGQTSPNPNSTLLAEQPSFTPRSLTYLIGNDGRSTGSSAVLRARELNTSVEVTVVLDGAYPTFSICGIRYYVFGEVTD